MRSMLLCCCAAIIGCAAPLQPKDPGPDPSVACFRGLEHDARFDKMKVRGAVGSAIQVTLEMAASRDKASDEEKSQLSILAVARQTCLDLGKAWRRTYAPPEIAVIYETLQMRVMDLMANLYGGDITWGEYIARRRGIASEFEQSRAQIATNLRNQEESRRRDAVNTLLLMHALQPQQQPSRQINCTTRYIGSTAYTSCQ